MIEGVCPKCGTRIRLRRFKAKSWPTRQWDALWRAFDKLMEERWS